MSLVYPIQYEHAPLRVRCAMLRKHPPVDPVLSCLSCFRKPSVGVCQVDSNTPDPGIAWPPPRFPPDLWRWFEENMASIRRLIHSGYIWPNRERRRVLTIEESGGFWVAWRTSLFLTKSDHLKPRILRRHHWSSASIRSMSALLTVQNSDAYNMMGTIYVLYKWSLVEVAICERHRRWSSFCIAVLVIAHRRRISGSLLQEEWIRNPRQLGL